MILVYNIIIIIINNLCYIIMCQKQVPVPFTENEWHIKSKM